MDWAEEGLNVAPPDPERQREEYAHHEAGHAVAMLAYGYTLDVVGIPPLSGGGKGFAKPALLPKELRKADEAVVAMAGWEAADCRLRGRGCRPGDVADADERRARRLDADGYEKNLRDAHELVRKYGDAIDRVAAELISRSRASSDGRAELAGPECVRIAGLPRVPDPVDATPERHADSGTPESE